MSFDRPAALLLLIFPILWCLYKVWSLRRGPCLTVSGLPENDTGTIVTRTLWIPSSLGALALAAAVVALAGPVKVLDNHKETRSGIALCLAVDRSGSMAREVGRGVRRIDAVKEALDAFVLGDGKDLGGRPNDLIGLVAFARYADTLYPLTLSREPFLPLVQSLDVVQHREEDGTSVGDALALAASRVVSPGDGSYEVKSRAVILLSDGENNGGDRSPAEAAELARAWDVRVYTIGFGGGRSSGGLLGFFSLQPDQTDFSALKKIAEETGGQFFQADSAGSLLEIYETIDSLERSEVEIEEFRKVKEHHRPFLWGAGILGLLAFVLSLTLYRRSL